MIKAHSYLDEVPKDINELFPKANITQVSLNKTAVFDIQKIDIEKFMLKIGSINESLMDDETDARKHGIPLDRTRIHNDNEYRTRYSQAADIIAKTKICDLMLQVIYMARHGVRRLEASPFFNKNDIGYRIGLLFSKMKRLHKKIRDIYQTMTNQDVETYFAWGERGEENRNLEREDRYVIMHHRVVKLHTDFIYLFWVTIKIDGMFTDLNEINIRQPQNRTGAGISIENKEIG